MTTSGQHVSIGVQPHVTTRTMGVLEAARHAADRGLASIFLCEHTHVPVDSARSESPLRRFPEWIKYMLDPYVALSFVAATTDLEVGTAVALPAQHDPIALAKAIATLDHLSGGRFVFGVGWGWLREEFEDHGGAPANQRVAVLREKLELMRRIWTDDVAAFEGDHARMSPSWSWPKPTQKPHPPVLIGVQGTQRNFDRISEWGDGWIPMTDSVLDEVLPGHVAALRATWERAGRDPVALDISILQRPEARDLFARHVERANELGLRRVLVQVTEERMDRLEAVLDEAAEALR